MQSWMQKLAIDYCTKGNFILFKELWEADQNIPRSTRNEQLQNCFHLAVIQTTPSHCKIVQFMASDKNLWPLASEADKSGSTPLHVAALNQNEQALGMNF